MSNRPNRWWLLALPLLLTQLSQAADPAASLSSQPPTTQACVAESGEFISWREHRIDDNKMSGAGIGGSDGLAIADIDRDGRIDVVAVHENSLVRVRVSFGTNDPQRWESFTLSPGPGENSESPTLVGGAEDVVLGDVNGDGRLDIVACGEAGVIVYFEAPAEPRKMADWKRTAVVRPQMKRNSWIRVDLADLDGDGQLEILGANKGGTDWVCFQRKGDPSVAASWTRQVIGATPMPINIRAVDIDQDGDVDVVGGSRGNRNIELFENLGNDKPWSSKWRPRSLVTDRITLATPASLTIGADKVNVSKPWKWHTSGFMVKFADLDGDGRTDIVTEAKHSGPLLWLKQPASLDGEWTPNFIGHVIPDHATGLELVDINGDGRLDLFVGGYSYTQRKIDTQTLTKAGTPCGRLAWFEQPADPTKPWVRHDVSRRAQGMFDMFFASDVNNDGLVDFITTRGNSRPLDGVIWLEQVRTAKPVAAFRGAWPVDQESRQQPIPQDN